MENQIKFIANAPAALLNDSCLAIADLHIGLELELARKGIMVPNQLLKIEQRLGRLIEQTSAKELIILGDIKHEYAGVSWLELRDVPEFFKRLLGKIKVSVVKGNHDAGIEGIAPQGINFYEPQGFLLGDVYFAHGQAWPNASALEAKTIIMGHIHPAIEFWSAGSRMTEHVWVKAQVDCSTLEKKFKKKCSLKRAILMPTFNHLSGGIAFNSESFNPIGPLLSKAIEWKNAEVFLLDGTALGELNKIKKIKLKHVKKK